MTAVNFSPWQKAKINAQAVTILHQLFLVMHMANTCRPVVFPRTLRQKIAAVNWPSMPSQLRLLEWSPYPYLIPLAKYWRLFLNYALSKSDKPKKTINEAQWWTRRSQGNEGQIRQCPQRGGGLEWSAGTITALPQTCQQYMPYGKRVKWRPLSVHRQNSSAPQQSIYVCYR